MTTYQAWTPPIPRFYCLTHLQTLLGHADLRSKKKDGNDGSEPARLGPLLLNKWYRVILDEASFTCTQYAL